MHRDEVAATQLRLLEENTALTRQIGQLTEELERLTKGTHDGVVEGSG